MGIGVIIETRVFRVQVMTDGNVVALLGMRAAEQISLSFVGMIRR